MVEAGLKRRAVAALSGALALIPNGAVLRYRDVFAKSTGRRRRLLGLLVPILRHRPLSSFELFHPAGDPAVTLAAVDSQLSQLLFWYGDSGYEGTEAEWWRRLCAQATSILELGTNIGHYTVIGALASPDATYTAVEANPAAATIASRNIELNSVSNVLLVNAAVVDEDVEEVELALPDMDQYVAPTGAYLAAGAEGVASRSAARRVRVPARTMSSLYSGQGLIKLDIEGYEARVLRSVLPSLLANRPIIVVEVLREAFELRSVILELHRSGYRVEAIGLDGLHPLSTEVLTDDKPLPRFGSRDVLLVPEERAHEL